jgi:histidinol-phosphate/aromatic aminotransferase/cobyric acid decarboxylase-like protein
LAERNLVLFGDVDAAIAGIVAQTAGPLILFPPAPTYGFVGPSLQSREVFDVARGFGRDGMISLESASDLPQDGLAIIASPGDPLGNVLSANDAVRLARSCEWLVIDERFADYAGQSLLNVASEFPNVIVLRSFQAKLGATDANAGWAVGSPRARDLLAAVSSPLPPGIARAVLATGTGKTSSRMLLSLVRDERSRLYRTLRKLSYLQPLPSWGPFVAARVEVGQRETLLALLGARGIRVHAPQEPGLERYIRVGIGTRGAMERLRRTLLDIAPEMLGGQLAGSGCDPYRLALRGEELSQSEFRQIEERRKRSA